MSVFWLVENDVMFPLCSPAMNEFHPEERQERENVAEFEWSSAKMAAQSPSDPVPSQWKKAGKQGKEMSKPEDERKPVAAKITESAK